METPFVIGDGLNMWDVTYVGNVADAHVLAAENLISSKTAAGEAFFISNNEPIAFRDLCLVIWAQFGHYPPFEMRVPAGLAVVTGHVWEWVAWLTGAPSTLSSGSVRDACGIRYINGKKAECILGYTPRVGIEEAIKTSCKVRFTIFCQRIILKHPLNLTRCMQRNSKEMPLERLWMRMAML